MVQNGLSVLETYLLVLEAFLRKKRDLDTKTSLSPALHGNGFLGEEQRGWHCKFWLCLISQIAAFEGEFPSGVCHDSRIRSCIYAIP